MKTVKVVFSHLTLNMEVNQDEIQLNYQDKMFKVNERIEFDHFTK